MVIIQRRRIVLVRSPELALPNRKTAVDVSGSQRTSERSCCAAARVRSVFDFKNIFDSSLFYRGDTWLTEFSYVVNYNKNYLLDITFMQSGM